MEMENKYIRETISGTYRVQIRNKQQTFKSLEETKKWRDLNVKAITLSSFHFSE